MAVGDKAAAKGLAVYAASQAHSLGYQNDNQRGDELADEITARTAADATLTAAVATKLDASKVVFSAAQPTFVAGTIWLKPV